VSPTAPSERECSRRTGSLDHYEDCMASESTSTRGFALYAPPQQEAPAVRPLAAVERLPLVDVLRGVAILGVLLAYTLWNLGSPPSETWSRIDRIVDVTGDTLVDGKFITIFAFLFGAGTAQQWQRIEASGQNPVGIHLRRMLFLLTAGLLHAALLRNGDILAPYAILGVALLAARRRSVRQLVVAAVLLALLPYAIKLGFGAIGWKLPHRPGAGGESVSRFRYWRENFDWLRYWYLTNPLLSWPRILTVMLAGVLAQRASAMARVAADARLARRLFATTFPIAVAGRIALVLLPGRWDPRHWTLARGIVLNEVYYVAIWSLAAVYVAAFALLCQRPGWPARLHWLRAVGRMAFTNYLIQALIVVPICLSFGLFDAITPTRGLLLALGVAAIQIPFSVWWLTRFEYGPVEWLWRTATYGARVTRLRV